MIKKIALSLAVITVFAMAFEVVYCARAFFKMADMNSSLADVNSNLNENKRLNDEIIDIYSRRLIETETELAAKLVLDVASGNDKGDGWMTAIAMLEEVVDVAHRYLKKDQIVKAMEVLDSLGERDFYELSEEEQAEAALKFAYLSALLQNIDFSKKSEEEVEEEVEEDETFKISV